jgi:hypothetical protein
MAPVLIVCRRFLLELVDTEFSLGWRWSIGSVLSPICLLRLTYGFLGLVLALALLRNGVPVRIINKQLQHSVGQRGAGVQVCRVLLFRFYHISYIFI